VTHRKSKKINTIEPRKTKKKFTSSYIEVNLVFAVVRDHPVGKY